MLFIEKPSHNLFVFRKQSSAAMLDSHSPAFEIVCVFHIQYEKIVNLFI